MAVTQARFTVPDELLGWRLSAEARNTLEKAIAQQLAELSNCDPNLRFLDWRSAPQVPRHPTVRLTAVISGQRGRFYNPMLLHFEMTPTSDQPQLDGIEQIVFSEFEPVRRNELRPRLEQRLRSRFDADCIDAILGRLRKDVPLVRRDDFLLRNPYVGVPTLFDRDFLGEVGSKLRLTVLDQSRGNPVSVGIEKQDSHDVLREQGWKDIFQGKVYLFRFVGPNRIHEFFEWQPELPEVVARRRPGSGAVYIEEYIWRYPRTDTPRVVPVPSPPG